jgi:malate dehydrogenase (oxaloacetate-decarboxylating)
MPVPGPGYSITIRVEAPPSASAAGDLTSAIGRVGGVITAFDVVDSHGDRLLVDITCNATSAEHAKDIEQALAELPDVEVRKVGHVQGAAAQP